jgi:drug/metabolite transporter (DMT)-like permease
MTRPLSITRTLPLVLLYAASNAAGDTLLAHALRHDPVRVAWLAVALACFAAGYGIFLGLLRHMPLSVLVPAQSSSYVVLAILAVTVLHEPVPPLRWLGTGLVTAGVSMVLLSERPSRPGDGGQSPATT